MQWSKQRSPRFEVGKPASLVGPGSYDYATTLDDHGGTIDGKERWQESPVDDSPGPGTYAAMKLEGALKCRHTPSKENVRPASRDKLRSSPSTLALQKEGKEERQKALAEKTLAELKASRRAAAEANSLTIAATRKVEELQKRFDDLAAQSKEANSRSKELEVEKVGRQKALHEKEVTLTSAQKALEQAKVQIHELREKAASSLNVTQELRDKEAEIQDLMAKAELHE
ncbi:unnamed protein product, partial [Polarella glacialis]